MASERQVENEPMARAVSAADVEKALAGIDFPKGKDEGKRLLAFERLTSETYQYFENDPLIVKDLRVFAKEAKWGEEGDIAIGVVETIPARKVFLKRIGERWFLENKQQSEKKEP